MWAKWLQNNCILYDPNSRHPKKIGSGRLKTPIGKPSSRQKRCITPAISEVCGAEREKKIRSGYATLAV